MSMPAVLSVCHVNDDGRMLEVYGYGHSASKYLAGAETNCKATHPIVEANLDQVSEQNFSGYDDPTHTFQVNGSGNSNVFSSPDLL